MSASTNGSRMPKARPSVRSAVAGFIRERIVRRMLPPELFVSANRNDRAGALHRAWAHVFTSHLQGGYYEFGVYRGAAFRDSYRVYHELFAWAQQ